MLDRAVDQDGARYTGPELFDGMKLEDDYPPYVLGDRRMTVPDTERGVINAGTLFAYQEPLFFGIECSCSAWHVSTRSPACQQGSVHQTQRWRRSPTRRTTLAILRRTTRSELVPPLGGRLVTEQHQGECSQAVPHSSEV